MILILRQTTTQSTTAQPLPNHEQERTRKNKKEKENNNNLEEEDEDIAAVVVFLKNLSKTLLLEYQNKFTEKDFITLKNYVHQYGLEKVKEAFKGLKSSKNVIKPMAWLTQFIRNDWSAPITIDLYTHQQILARKYGSFLKEIGYDKVSEFNEKMIDQKQKIIIFKERLDDYIYELTEEKLSLDLDFEDFKQRIINSQNDVMKHYNRPEIKQKQAAIKAK